jgi:hypothetical protein
MYITFGGDISSADFNPQVAQKLIMAIASCLEISKMLVKLESVQNKERKLLAFNVACTALAVDADQAGRFKNKMEVTSLQVITHHCSKLLHLNLPNNSLMCTGCVANARPQFRSLRH